MVVVVPNVAMEKKTMMQKSTGPKLGGLAQLSPFGDDGDKLGAGGFRALDHHSTGSLSHKSFSSRSWF